MIDYWPDGEIDCKDYAIHNSIKAESIGGKNIEWIIIGKEGLKHVVVKFEKSGNVYVADLDKLYCTSCPNSRVFK